MEPVWPKIIKFIQNGAKLSVNATENQDLAELEPTGGELAENGTDLQAALICYAPQFERSDHEYPMSSPEEIELTGDLDLVSASPPD